MTVAEGEAVETVFTGELSGGQEHTLGLVGEELRRGVDGFHDGIGDAAGAGHAWVGIEVESRDDFRELTDSDSANDTTDGAVHLLRDVGELQLERDGGGCCCRCCEGSHDDCLSGLFLMCGGCLPAASPRSVS
ncbi:hypothetical protein [Corynebacterium amycolatum]